MMFGRGYNSFAGCFGFGPGFVNGGGGIVIMLAIIVIAIIVITIAIRQTKGSKVENEVKEMLKLRYAKGEISEEEYIRRKNILD